VPVSQADFAIGKIVNVSIKHLMLSTDDKAAQWMCAIILNHNREITGLKGRGKS
jgi:hypothetical protein